MVLCLALSISTGNLKKFQNLLCWTTENFRTFWLWSMGEKETIFFSELDIRRCLPWKQNKTTQTQVCIVFFLKDISTRTCQGHIQLNIFRTTLNLFPQIGFSLQCSLFYMNCLKILSVQAPIFVETAYNFL